ncbi:MAG: TfoX/Sxy family protein [Candidatus Paceibacterota bacterium]
MATQKETIEFIIEKLRDPKRFAARAMFGEYALYADGKVVALVCDDQLYVKITPESSSLEAACEKGPPYPGARPHYIVTEEQLSQIDDLREILINISAALPEKKKKHKRTD